MISDPNCRQCPLWEHATHVCIPGRQVGVWDGVVIVGEAPGQQEDIAGKPFVGPTGEKLAEALDTIGIKDAFLTNTVRCFPGRALTSSHIAACKGYLREELDELKPRFILALGSSAWHQFGRGAITEQAGKEVWDDARQCWIMPALHPAAILRNPNSERSWMADLYRFARIVRGELVRRPPVVMHLVETREDIDELLELLKQGFTYDFETNAIPWWHRDFKALTVAFSNDGKNSWVMPLDHPGTPLADYYLDSFYREIVPILTDPKIWKTAHNGIFDDLVWYRITGVLPYTTCDTMVLAHLLDENRPKALKYLGRALLGWPDWGVDTTNLINTPLDEVAVYNGYDAAATKLMRSKLLTDLRDNDRLMQYFLRLEMPKLRALDRIIARGIYIDPETLQQRIAEARIKQAEARAQIPVKNPASTQQLATWLYEELKLPCPKLTKAGKKSTDEDTIRRLARREPRIRIILEERKWARYLNTYLLPLETSRSTSIDARMHPDYRTTGTETGRLSSSFHTTPRDTFVRSVYSAPAAHTLLMADYGQIEARLAAWAALGCPSDAPSVLASHPRSMLSAWLTGQDVYILTAAAVLGKDPSLVTRNSDDPRNERQILGKPPTLALLYRMGPDEFRDYVWREFEIEWTIQFARQVHEAFFKRWPELRTWHAHEERLIRWRGYVTSAIGRVRHLPGAKMQGYAAFEAVKQGINHPIQSLASELTQVSMIALDQMGYKIVGNVHDALLIEARDEDVASTVAKMRYIMEHADLILRPLGLHLPPGLLNVEVKAGPWGLGKLIPA